jgi:hypothetical protein
MSTDNPAETIVKLANSRNRHKTRADAAEKKLKPVLDLIPEIELLLQEDADTAPTLPGDSQ